MHEMRDFAKAVEVVKDFINLHPNTLLVVTADHSTGGLSVGGWDKKEWHPNRIKQINIAIPTLANKLMAQDHDVNVISKLLAQYIEFKLDNIELLKLVQARTSGSLESIKKTLRAILNKRTMTGWTTLNHSADDVQIFAYGRGKDKFTGSMENTEIGKKLMNIVASSQSTALD
jgi:alkaline phosphatase